MDKGRLEAFSDGVLAIIIMTINPLIGCALYVLVAVNWLIPDPRIEKKLAEEGDQ